MAIEIVVDHMNNLADTEDRLATLSLGGGCWAFDVLPFTHKVTFSKFANPSSVPDHFYDAMCPNRLLGWGGKLVPFTKAAIIREQNRGVSGDS